METDVKWQEGKRVEDIVEMKKPDTNLLTNIPLT